MTGYLNHNCSGKLTLMVALNIQSPYLMLSLPSGDFMLPPHLLLFLYQSIIQPIFLFCSTCFFNMLSDTNRAKITRVTITAAEVIGLPTPNLSELNNMAIACIAFKIEQDPSHPLYHHLTPLPLGRRYRTLKEELWYFAP